MASSQNLCCKCKDQVTALGDFRYKAAKQNCNYCHSQVHETCRQKVCQTKSGNNEKTEIQPNQLKKYLNNIKKQRNAIRQLEQQGPSYEQLFMFYLTYLPTTLAFKIIQYALDIYNYKIIQENISNMNYAQTDKDFLITTLQQEMNKPEFLQFKITKSKYEDLKNTSIQMTQNKQKTYLFIPYWRLKQYLGFDRFWSAIFKILELQQFTIEPGTRLIFNYDQATQPTNQLHSKTCYIRFIGIQNHRPCLFKNISPLELMNTICCCKINKPICACRRK